MIDGAKGRHTRLAMVALLTMAINLLARAIGFGWHAGIAYKLGATAEADTFLLASTIPLIVYTVISAIVAVALVPTFQSALSVRNLRKVLLWMTSLGVIGAIHPLLVKPESHLEWVLSLVMTPSLPLAMACGALMAWHFAQGRYFLVPTSALFNNLACVGVLFLDLKLDPVWAGAWSINSGWLLQLISLTAATLLYRIPLAQKPVADLTWRDVYPQVWPMMVTQVALQVPFIGARYLGGQMDTGTVSAYNYALRVVLLPGSVVSGSVLGAAYPVWTARWNQGDHSGAVAVMTKATRLMFMLLLPLLVFFCVAAEAITAVLFQRGAFVVSDTIRTAAFLRFSAAAMVGTALWDIATRILHTQGRRIESTWVVAVGAAACLILEWFSAKISFQILLLVSGAGVVATAVFLLARMNCREEYFSAAGRDLRKLLIPTACVAMVTGVVAWMTQPGILQTGLLWQVGYLVGLAVLLFGGWLLLCRITGVEEAELLYRGLAKRFQRFRWSEK